MAKEDRFKTETEVLYEQDYQHRLQKAEKDNIGCRWLKEERGEGNIDNRWLRDSIDYSWPRAITYTIDDRGRQQ